MISRQLASASLQLHYWTKIFHCHNLFSFLFSTARSRSFSLGMNYLSLSLAEENVNILPRLDAFSNFLFLYIFSLEFFFCRFHSLLQFFFLSFSPFSHVVIFFWGYFFYAFIFPFCFFFRYFSLGSTRIRPNQLLTSIFFLFYILFFSFFLSFFLLSFSYCNFHFGYFFSPFIFFLFCFFFRFFLLAVFFTTNF